MAQIIDGKAIAAALYEKMRAEVDELALKYGRRPGLWAVIVGEDPASQVYVNNNLNRARKTGLVSEVINLPESTRQDELLKVLGDLNEDERVDGILLQLPLPAHIDKDAAISAIAPDKDIDGYAGMAGGLSARRGAVAPCTSRACIELIKSTGIPVEGKHAVVVGRGELVGKPVAALLLGENATVTIAHSRTQDLAGVLSGADIVVAAVGRAGLITGDMLKPGAIVIDVGINRTEDGRIVGDVEFESAARRAGYITPVPGGVGPMTIAMLIRNTLDCYLKHTA
ncbi:MAG: bifunctional 5,10-methylenetetrahydrofolate dehydrogenase/5,10-methenyltetrahydrofolate cyclohydrolase [Bacteroidales bacterium]|nr:bifunctional 5,10-methylenetetrahydrofolate dehydrogenase/5,10-methenyltetrahydrofolate cyclohydrolase [Bacteroidales bacterium]